MTALFNAHLEVT